VNGLVRALAHGFPSFGFASCALWVFVCFVWNFRKKMGGGIRLDSGLFTESGWKAAYSTGQTGRHGEEWGERGRNGGKWGDSDARGVPYSTGGASGSARWLLEWTRFGLRLIKTCNFSSSR
jgi:hypothetical protein